MKKGFLIFLMGIVSFLGINTVSADTYKINTGFFNASYTYSETQRAFLDKSDIISSIYNKLYDYYLDNFASEYPYYYFSIFNIVQDFEDGHNIYSYIYYLKDKHVIGANEENSINPSINVDGFMTITYTVGNDNPYSEITAFNPNDDPDNNYNIYILQNYSTYFYSNFDLLISNSSDSSFVIDYSDMFVNSTDTITLSNNSVLPTFQDILNLDIISNSSDMTTYTEINLNEHPYIALSLKNYEERDTFYTNVYVKGNYCLTPVYNYGMTEKKDIITGSQNQRCSPYYNSETLIRTYILKQDIENHAIYYLKAYDTTKDNIVKIDTSVFDITYITEDTKDNPYVSINGKQYPTIAYDNLTDTAIKSEDDDYISGVSCQVGDFNCYNEYNSENIFDSIFDSPLKILKNIWSSITSVFDIITEFIMLLPETMQSFLFLSFMIAIILGLIKIIL